MGARVRQETIHHREASIKGGFVHKKSVGAGRIPTPNALTKGLLPNCLNPPMDRRGSGEQSRAHSPPAATHRPYDGAGTSTEINITKNARRRQGLVLF